MLQVYWGPYPQLFFPFWLPLAQGLFLNTTEPSVHHMDPALGTRTLLCFSLASLLHLAWANCEASNLLQLPPGVLGALERGRDWHGKADAVSLSSPEFSALLPKLDAKMEPLTASNLKGDLDC